MMECGSSSLATGFYLLSCLLLLCFSSSVLGARASTWTGKGLVYQVENRKTTWPSTEKTFLKERRRRKALAVCLNEGTLNLKQRKMCLKFPLQVMATFRAFRYAIIECSHQFRHKRWNCSSFSSIRDNAMQPMTSEFMKRGFKEVAFVNALIAASVARTVSIDCARGVITSCGRRGSPKRRAKKDYVTYNDAISHGLYFSEKYLNSVKNSNDIPGSVNRHNLRIGRMVFKETLATRCKCHGVSGTCSAKTCLQVASELRKIGDVIKAMFENARRVTLVNERRAVPKLLVANTRQDTTKPANDTTSSEIHTKKHQLLYVEDSPSFCEPDDVLGITGVTGRICNKDPRQENSCQNICCFAGYREYWIVKEEDCKCRFHYCCFIRCNRCKEKVLIAKCK